MKKQNLVITTTLAMALASSCATAKDLAPQETTNSDRAPASVKMRSDCTSTAKNVVAAAYGADVLNDDSRHGIVVKNVRILKTRTNGAGTQDVTYRAHVDGDGFVGIITLTATRGGCLVDTLDLDGSNNQ